MDPLLANIDLNSNPYAGTEHDTNKSLRDFALERIMARRENRSQLAQIAWDMRRAVGPDGFHPELRKAVQAFIKFDVESAGGRPSARAFFQEARDLLLYASSPQTIVETTAEASEKRNSAAIQARIAQAAGIILNDNRELTTNTFPKIAASTIMPPTPQGRLPQLRHPQSHHDPQRFLLPMHVLRKHQRMAIRSRAF